MSHESHLDEGERKRKREGGVFVKDREKKERESEKVAAE